MAVSCLSRTLPQLLTLTVIGLTTITSAHSAPNVDLEKGIIYVQPSYHYTNTLSLDIEVLKKDVVSIKQNNFSNLGLRASWGELMSHWNATTRQATYNETNCKALETIAGVVGESGLRLIFNTHMLDTVPQGIDGAYFVPSSGPDIFNVSGGNGKGVWRSLYKDAVVRDSYKEPMVLFHTKFAACLSAHPTVPRFWKHAFESVYLFPQQLTQKEVDAGYASEAQRKFGLWALSQNKSIEHWSNRWVEPSLKEFTNITLPINETTPGFKQKFGDFWRFWLLAVLRDGTYGLSLLDIVHGLRDGAGDIYQPELAFKHWRPANLLGLSDLTKAEVIEAFDLPINATALGYYVNDVASLALEPAAFETYVNSVKAVAPPNLPIIDWETGASTYKLNVEQQVQWAKYMVATAKSTGLLGYNWWQYIDWAPTSTDPCVGSKNCELLHFGAHYLNGTAKPVWDVL
eukprot:m.188697 g.188697  ORF g.188697 m.188697 type:complete len:458 (+) comp32354_c0_seq2:21-1394(+)